MVVLVGMVGNEATSVGVMANITHHVSIVEKLGIVPTSICKILASPLSYTVTRVRTTHVPPLLPTHTTMPLNASPTITLSWEG